MSGHELSGSRDRRATLALLVAMWLWGSSFVALKIAFVDLDPLFVIFARMAIALACFVPLWRWIRPRKRLTGRDIRWLIILVLFEPCLYFVFEALALERTSASQAGMISALLPLMVAVGAWAFLRERISRRTSLGFVLAVIGALWLSLSGESNHHAPAPLMGNLLELAAMMAATAYTLLVKHLTSRVSAWFITAWQALAGTLFFGTGLILFPSHWPASLSALPGGLLGNESLWAVLYLGIAVSLGAYGLFNWAISRVPANQASAFVNLLPLFAAVQAFMVLGETFTPIQMVAASLVLAGVWISQDSRTDQVSDEDAVIAAPSTSAVSLSREGGR
ncbi:DMT family transporter [Cobetia sp. QF-1]|uniref:DMT family transporter n=1 Tax=Cobetia sp. QF-1 TaxID=1969833 RepID=UPI000B5408CB|nr:DMT family transporter [Cobetia sp. QF-1]